MSIETRKDKKTGKVKYIARVYFGTKEDGSLDLRSKSFDKKKDAQEHESRLEDFKKNRVSKTISDKAILSAVFNKYIEKISLTKKDNTIRNYKGVFNKWIKPRLEHFQISGINNITFNRFFTEMRQEGASDYTVNYVHILLFEIFKYASDPLNRYIKENPMLGIERPKLEYNPTDTIKFWSKKEAEKVLKAAIGSEYYLVITLMINTGIRVSEMSAITEGNIDLEKKVLNVTHQISNYSPRANEEALEESFVLGPTKNRSTRSIPLNNSAYEAVKLSTDKNKAKKNYFLFSPERKTKNYKVITKRGLKAQFIEAQLITPRNLANVLKKLCEQAGVAYIGPHGLRHTFAANFLMNGGDLFTLSRILGHKNISSTQIYLHLTSGYLKSAMNIVEFGG